MSPPPCLSIRFRACRIKPDGVLIRSHLGYLLAGVILLVIIILFSVYNHQIVEFLQGPADTIKKYAIHLA